LRLQNCVEIYNGSPKSAVMDSACSFAGATDPNVGGSAGRIVAVRLQIRNHHLGRQNSVSLRTALQGDGLRNLSHAVQLCLGGDASLPQPPNGYCSRHQRHAQQLLILVSVTGWPWLVGV
jgi:hypothetical protein